MLAQQQSEQQVQQPFTISAYNDANYLTKVDKTYQFLRYIRQTNLKK